MLSVKKVSELTGISIRTLHYYDEIGLLKPTEISESGYRYYDEKALERLQGKEDDPCYKGAFIVADMMIDNLDRYGVPCAAWVE